LRLDSVPIPTPSGLAPGDPWLKKWLVASRAPFLTASVLPALAATAAAWRREGALRTDLAVLPVIGVALIHLGANLANDYFDHRSGADEANKVPTPFSGGSRVIQEGLLSAGSILVASVSLLLAGCAIGIYLWLASPGHGLLAIGLAGVALGWFYTSPPLRLAHRGWGELAVGLGFGVLPAMGVEWVHRGTISPEVSWVGLPAGLLVAAILVINEFPDIPADASAGKRTLVVRLGPARAVRVYEALVLGAYGSVGAGILLGWMPKVAAVVALVAPLSWKAVMVLRRHHSDVRAVLPAMAATIAQQSIFVVLLAGAYVADLGLRAA